MFSKNKGNIIMILLIFYIIIISVLINIFSKFFVGFSDYQNLFISQILIFIVPVVFYLLISKNKFEDVFQLKPLSLKNILYVIAIVFLFLPINTLISIFASMYFPNEIGELMMNQVSNPYLLSIAVIALTPSICEEAMFRGILLSEFKNEKPWLAILMNGIFFGIMHMNIQQSSYALVLGMLLSFMVLQTGSIFSSMIAHFVFNSFSVTLLYVSVYFQNLPEFKEAFDVANSVDSIELSSALKFYGFLSLFLLPFLLLVVRSFIRYNKKIKKLQNEKDLIFDLISENKEQNNDLINMENKTVTTKSVFNNIVFSLTTIIMLVLYFSIVLAPKFIS